ncbi:MAG: hypothetical protein IAI50_09610 [Candidatus Eremiobacteraeota bacterium]|nr:hypothetical protein [Candidatus Eremiobacteraeota bacterium]
MSYFNKYSINRKISLYEEIANERKETKKLYTEYMKDLDSAKALERNRLIRHDLPNTGRREASDNIVGDLEDMRYIGPGHDKPLPKDLYRLVDSINQGGLPKKAPETSMPGLSHYAANFTPHYGPAGAIKVDRLNGPIQPVRHVRSTDNGPELATILNPVLPPAKPLEAYDNKILTKFHGNTGKNNLPQYADRECFINSLPDIDASNYVNNYVLPPLDASSRFAVPFDDNKTGNFLMDTTEFSLDMSPLFLHFFSESPCMFVLIRYFLLIVYVIRMELQHKECTDKIKIINLMLSLTRKRYYFNFAVLLKYILFFTIDSLYLHVLLYIIINIKNICRKKYRKKKNNKDDR